MSPGFYTYCFDYNLDYGSKYIATFSVMISTRSDKAPKHVRNYYRHFGYDESDTILCECCGVPAVDLHHIEPRSSFGSKRKGDQDDPSNLIALCRLHHDLAHGSMSRNWKETFKAIVSKRYKQTV